MDIALRGILLGMTLGDGYIARDKQGNYRLQIEHATTQRDYAVAKLQRLKGLLGGRGELQVRDRFDKRTGKTYSTCYFVVGNNKFNVIHKYVYYDNAKCFRRSMLDMLTPEGIAYWYMDDGYGKAVYTTSKNQISSVYTMLYTYCSESEVLEIIKYFSEVWNIHPGKIRMYGDKWVVKFNTSESKKFIGLILDFIHPSMSYKVAHVQTQLLQECSRTKVQCENCGIPLTRLSRLQLCIKCHDKARYLRLRYSPNSRKEKPTEVVDKEPSR